VFDSSDVQQTIEVDCNSSGLIGNTTQEQVVTTDCRDTVILNERSSGQASDHNYANFNISQTSQKFNKQDNQLQKMRRWRN